MAGVCEPAAGHDVERIVQLIEQGEHGSSVVLSGYGMIGRADRHCADATAAKSKHLFIICITFSF